MTVHTEMSVTVTDIELVADAIKQFTLERVDGQPMPAFAPGAHIVVSMMDAGRLRRNPYSLMSSPRDPWNFRISVLRVEQSRGGSVFMHDVIAVGDTLTISQPVNLFPVDILARRNLFIAGGVGITPFIPMMEVLNEKGGVFELYYSIRSRSHGAFWSEMSALYPNRVKIAVGAEGYRFDYHELLINQPLGTHLYVCGPKLMLEHIFNIARDLGWAKENLHFELFLAPPPGSPFTAKLASSGKEIVVAEHQSLLESVEEAGVDAPFLCRAGACGQCETRVLASDGEIIHNDIFLTDEERKSGTKIMPCVSRFVGVGLTIEL
ncbi:MAG: oxidoreductase [Acidimicrobiaceae bacterium]|nr:oxidoreductase [Acidimicrobiaceae bacterium]